MNLSLLILVAIGILAIVLIVRVLESPVDRAMKVMARGDFKEAITQLEYTTTRIGRNSPDSLELARAFAGLAMVRMMTNDFSGAESAIDRAAPIVKLNLGDQHTSLAQLWRLKGRSELGQEHYDKAETSFNNALRLLQTKSPTEPKLSKKYYLIGPPGHEDVLTDFADLCEAKGELSEAADYASQAISLIEADTTGDAALHNQVLVYRLKSYAILLKKLNRDTEAEAVETRMNALATCNS